MVEILDSGAEAVIEKHGRTIVKNRMKKGYRLGVLDERIRKLRTRHESKLLEKAAEVIAVPEVKTTDEKEKTISMQLITGKKLSQHLEKIKLYESVCEQIGESLAKLHDADIIHGDLTTSNMILKKDTVYFIDFGLGFRSTKSEDKAVDLHLLKQALDAKHPTIFESAYAAVLRGYAKSKNVKETMNRLAKVEKRGRYKAQY